VNLLSGLVFLPEKGGKWDYEIVISFVCVCVCVCGFCVRASNLGTNRSTSRSLEWTLCHFWVIQDRTFQVVILVMGARGGATSRKVAGSIPDGGTEIFHLRTPSGCTVTLGSTQPLTEMSTRSIS
jgi:hypothetical protein